MSRLLRMDSPLSPANLVAFARRVFAEGYLYALAQGNVDAQAAVAAFEDVYSLLGKPKPLSADRRYKEEIIQLVRFNAITGNM